MEEGERERRKGKEEDGWGKEISRAGKALVGKENGGGDGGLWGRRMEEGRERVCVCKRERESVYERERDRE